MIRKLANGQQATIALIDSLSKVTLTCVTCVPEPEPTTFNRAVAIARDRYQQILEVRGASMKGDFMKSLTDIIQ